MSKKEKLQQHLLKYGFFFQTADIYGGLKGFYDYGPIGVRIKRKFINLWRRFFTNKDKYYEIEGSLILPYEVLKASGHVDKFTDPIVYCKKCKTVYRADHLIEDVLGMDVSGKTIEELDKIIKENNIKCPKCNGELSDVEEKNLMFKLEIGYGVEKRIGYLRPETAQSIFINFLNVAWNLGVRLPFAIFQIGKAFRNEISPRKFLIRLREFTQMEIEHFFIPEDKDNEEEIDNLFEEVKDIEIRVLFVGEKEPKKVKVKELVEKLNIPKLLAYYLAKEYIFYKNLGIPEDDLYFRQIPKEELPHYSKANFDLEIKSEYGNIEVVGNAYRTNYDIKNHSEKSKKDMAIKINGKKYYPHVVEPSFGVERSLLIILEKAFVEENIDRKYSWLKLNPLISPYLIAVIPLLKNKKEIVDKAKEIYRFLRKEFEDDVIFLSEGSIGKMYSKLDSIGVPYVITIDYQTLEDESVTIRFRDTKNQIRIKYREIPEFIRNELKRYLINLNINI